MKNALALASALGAILACSSSASAQDTHNTETALTLESELGSSEREPAAVPDYFARSHRLELDRSIRRLRIAGWLSVSVGLLVLGAGFVASWALSRGNVDDGKDFVAIVVPIPFAGLGLLAGGAALIRARVLATRRRRLRERTATLDFNVGLGHGTLTLRF